MAPFGGFNGIVLRLFRSSGKPTVGEFACPVRALQWDCEIVIDTADNMTVVY